MGQMWGEEMRGISSDRNAFSFTLSNQCYLLTTVKGTVKKRTKKQKQNTAVCSAPDDSGEIWFGSGAACRGLSQIPTVPWMWSSVEVEQRADDVVEDRSCKLSLLHQTRFYSAFAQLRRKWATWGLWGSFIFVCLFFLHGVLPREEPPLSCGCHSMQQEMRRLRWIWSCDGGRPCVQQRSLFTTGCPSMPLKDWAVFVFISEISKFHNK